MLIFKDDILHFVSDMKKLMKTEIAIFINNGKIICYILINQYGLWYAGLRLNDILLSLSSIIIFKIIGFTKQANFPYMDR